MPPEIRRLADKFLMNPKEVSVAPPATAAETITQGLAIVSHGDGRGPGAGHREKRAVLRALLKRENVRNALIFCNRKRDVAVVFRSLERHGFNVGQLHGDMSQPARNEMLARFKKGEVTLLVCSDVAARGLDIEDMSHVFNFDVPIHSEDYVHRIGRTGRAGREGHAYTIAIPEDAEHVAAIETLIGKPIPRIAVEGFGSAELAAGEGRERGGYGGGRGRGGRGGRGHGRGPRHGREHGRDHGRGHGRSERESGHRPQAARPSERPRHSQPSPQQAAAPKAEPRHERRHAESKPVKGLGDHMPAFLRKS